jgi:pimeloyl-ACP methyl ester carboxylesterase
MNRIGLLLLVVIASACSTTRSFKAVDGKKLPNSITQIQRVELNGNKQFVTIRSTNQRKPVLLWLHGGPGNVAMPLYMHYGASLEQHFTVVYWDQRGSGKSYSSRIDLTSMTLDQFVSDTHELTSWLKKRFNQDKIFLVGHSWGGLLGLHVIDKYPTDYYAFVAVSPITDGPRSEQLSYEFTINQAKQQQDTVALTTLKRIGPPVNGVYKGGISDANQERNLVQKYGGAYHQNLGGSIYKILRQSTEYNRLDYLKANKIARLSSPMFLALLPTIDLKRQIPALSVPIYFCLGRYDYVCPTTLVTSYYESLQAPFKEVIWFEESAHHACFEEFKKFNSVMEEKLLPIGTRQALK